jgi:hypoxanthine phosphoribosyltransferase
MGNISQSSQNAANVLKSAQRINERLHVLARQINEDYFGREIDMVCFTNSAMTFTTDLMRLVKVPVRLHLMAFDSYQPAPKSGEVRLTLDLAEPLAGRHVLIVEGMIISGRTPLYMMNLLRLRQPESIEICVVGSKPLELVVGLSIKYRLFEFSSEWVAGYGIGNSIKKTSSDLVDLSSMPKDMS